MRKIFIFMMKFLGSLGIILILLGCLLAWRLHYAPLNLNFVQKHIEEYYPHIHPHNISLIWKNIYEEPQIIIEDTEVDILECKIIVPKVLIDLSLIDLAFGSLVYDKITLIQPHVLFLGHAETEATIADNMKIFLSALSQFNTLQKTTMPLIEVDKGRLSSKKGVHGIEGARIISHRKRGALHINFEATLQNENDHFDMYGYLEQSFESNVAMHITFKDLHASFLDGFPISPIYTRSISGAFSGNIEAHLENTEKGFCCTLKSKLQYLERNQPININANSTLAWSAGRLDYDLWAQTQNIDKEVITKLWPKSINMETCRWIDSHFIQAHVPNAEISIKGYYENPQNDVAPTISGTFFINNADLKFLDTLPAVEDCIAKATFDNEQIIFDISQGHTKNIQIQKGQMRISNLSGTPKTHFSLTVLGPLSDALWYIQHAPLAYQKKFNLQISNASGDAEVTIDFAFPLLETLSPEQIKANITAKITNAHFNQKFFDQLLHVTQAGFELFVGEDSMHLDGRGLLDNVPATINWSAPKDTSSFKNKYHLDLNGPVESIDLIQKMLPANTLNGPISLSVDLTDLKDNAQHLVLIAKLDATDIHVPELGWHKAPTIPGALQATFLLKNYTFQKMKNFILESKNVEIQGNATFNKNKIRAWHFDKIHLEKTNCTASAHQDSNSTWHVHLEGPKLSLKHYIKNAENPFNVTSDKTSFFVSAKIGQVFLEKGVIVYGLNLSAYKSIQEWVNLNLDGHFSETAYIVSKLRTVAQEKELTAESNNLGLLLKGLNVSEDYVNGKVSLRMTRPVVNMSAPYKGEITIHDLRVVDAPTAEIFNKSKANKNVIIERGTKFDIGRADLNFSEGQLVIQNAIMHNNTTGLTAEGYIDIGSGTIKLKGAVVPAFMINHMLAHIPILGTLLSGGNEHNGIVSISFTLAGSFKEYELKINPFSAFAPGFVKQALK